MKSLPLRLKCFIWFIYIITIIFSIFFYKLGYSNIGSIPDFKYILFFSIVSILTETLSVFYKNMSFSTNFAFTMGIFILYGPLYAMLNKIIVQTFKIIKAGDKYKHIFNTPVFGTVFNYASSIITTMISSALFFEFGGHIGVENLTDNIIQIILFLFSMFLINSIIVSILSAITSKKSFIYCFIRDIRLMSLNIFGIAPLGIVLAILYEKYEYTGIILLLFPIILTRYTFYLYVQANTQNEETIHTLMKAIENRDEYTEGHSQRVADLAIKIAKKLRYSEWRIEDIRTASMLHDVGKIGVRDNVLNKPGKLTEEEYNIIKSHPEKGYDILKGINSFKKILPIIKYHHERYDGKGYPEGKNAEDLGIEVFIVQLADSIDAMSTDRPYRKALTKEEIIGEIKKCSGTQFHPKVVEAYIKVIESEENVRS